MVMTSTRSLALTMAACAISTCNTQSDVDALKLTAPLMRVPSFRKALGNRNGKAKKRETTSASATWEDVSTGAAASLPVTTPTGNGVPPAFDGSSTEVNTITILELKDEGNEGLISRIKEDFFRLLAETVRTESTVQRKYTDTEITAYVMRKYMIELQTPLIDMLRKKYEDGEGRPVHLKYKEYFEVDLGNDDDELYRIPILKQHEVPTEKRGQHEVPIEKNVRFIGNKLDVEVLYDFDKITYDEFIKERNKDQSIKILNCQLEQSDLIINIAFQLIQRFLSKRTIRGRPISDDINNIIGAMRYIDMTSEDQNIDESTETISISTSQTIAQDPEKVLSHAQNVRSDRRLDERSFVELKRQAAAVENNNVITVQQDWLKRMEGSMTRI